MIIPCICMPLEMFYPCLMNLMSLLRSASLKELIENLADQKPDIIIADYEIVVLR